VSSARCPSCAAAVPVGAPWCTLCFADLRPQPEPVPVSAAALATPVAPDSPTSAPAAPLPPDPILDAPVHRTAPVAGGVPTAWPCSGCGTSVPFEEMTCPNCGSPFLGEESPRMSLVLPGIGDVSQLSSSGRIMLMAGGCLVVTFVLFIVFLLLGGLV
jgi:hypothetical protein